MSQVINFFVYEEAMLMRLDLDNLKEIADSTGIGYHDLDETQLREKLLLEGK